MLNAAESAIYAAADDEAERARAKAKLYMPPKGQKRVRPAAMRLDAGQAQALAAQLAAEDARLTGEDTG